MAYETEVFERVMLEREEIYRVNALLVELLNKYAPSKWRTDFAAKLPAFQLTPEQIAGLASHEFRLKHILEGKTGLDALPALLPQLPSAIDPEGQE